MSITATWVMATIIAALIGYGVGYAVGWSCGWNECRAASAPEGGEHE